MTLFPGLSPELETVKISLYFGDSEEAYQIAAGIKCSKSKIVAYCVIARTQETIGDHASAKKALTRAQSLLESLKTSSEEAYCELAKAQACLKEIAAARETIERSKRTLAGLPALSRIFPYREIARTQVHFDDLAGAKVTLREAKSFVSAVEHSRQNEAYYSIALTEVEFGLYDDAKKTANNLIDAENYRFWVYKEIALDQVAAHQYKQAHDTAYEITNNDIRSDTYLQMLYTATSFFGHRIGVNSTLIQNQRRCYGKVNSTMDSITKNGAHTPADAWRVIRGS